jgi:hypothetical protein
MDQQKNRVVSILSPDRDPLVDAADPDETFFDDLIRPRVKSGRTTRMQARRLRLKHSSACSCFGLGRYLYHFTGVWVDLGLLKRVARAWKPSDISEATIMRTLLAEMQAGDRMLNQLVVILNEEGPDKLPPILRSLGLSSLDYVDNLDTLQKILASLDPTA